jgi:RloB-like protein
MTKRGERDLRRRPPRRDPKLRILVVCEGRVTEPGYLRALRSEHRTPLVEIEIDSRGGTPKTLVERAAERKRQAEREAKSQRDDFLRYDEVWCVFDVDEHPKLADARQQARAHGIHLAVSNPCFELWALLHFQAQTAHVERQTVRSRLKRHLPGYDKELPFTALRPHYETAVRRAQDLDARCERDGCPGSNPSTGVHRLAEQIRAQGKAALIELLKLKR